MKLMDTNNDRLITLHEITYFHRNSGDRTTESLSKQFDAANRRTKWVVCTRVWECVAWFVWCCFVCMVLFCCVSDLSVIVVLELHTYE